MTTTTTKPARVLTVEQRVELWDLFCSYGRLRGDAEAALPVGRDFEASQGLRRAADEVQERFGALIWSLTERPYS